MNISCNKALLVKATPPTDPQLQRLMLYDRDSLLPLRNRYPRLNVRYPQPLSTPPPN